MMTPKQARREAKQLFRLCLVAGRLDEDRARLVVERILRSRTRGYLALLGYLLRLLKLDHAGHTAEVESAESLPPDLQVRVQDQITQTYGSGFTALFAQNSALIGGMRIKVGNDIYDGSVRSRVAALQRSFGITPNGGTVPA